MQVLFHIQVAVGRRVAIGFDAFVRLKIVAASELCVELDFGGAFDWCLMPLTPR
jgi:hypothetical protein